MDETNSLDNLLGSTELPVTPNSAQDLTIEQQSANIEAKSELAAQAAAPTTQRTLSLSQRLMKEKRTSAFDWLTVYLWKDNDFFHAYNQSAYIIVNQLYTGEIKEQNNNRPLKVAKYRTSEGNYILAGFPVRSLNKYVSSSNLQRVVEDCVEIAVPASIIDKSIDDLNKDYESWTKTLTDINLCKFQPKKREVQQQYKYQGPVDESQNQASSQQNGQENYPGPKPTVVQEQPANPMSQAEPIQNSRQVTSTYYKKPYSSDYWGNYHQKNQSSWNNGGGYYSNGYQKPTWKFASYWNKEEQNQATQPSQQQTQQYAAQQYSQPAQQYVAQQQFVGQQQYTQPIQQQSQQQQTLPSSYTMFDLIRDIIRFQPEMTSPTDAMGFLIGLKQKVNRFLI